jgi:hypothetical protein
MTGVEMTRYGAMKTYQQMWTPAIGFEPSRACALPNADLVLVFGSIDCFDVKEHFIDIRNAYPKAKILGCSTSGEIADIHLRDGSLIITAVEFENTRVEGGKVALSAVPDAYHAGQELARTLSSEGLTHVFVLADGIHINGSALSAGMTSCLGPNVAITGGLAGDGGQMKRTAVLWNETASSDIAAAVGFYGDRLRIGYGSLGGWDPFGPERVITRSKGNILFEMDEVSALEIYKSYLGEHAKDLPASALLFPLAVRTQDRETGLVRTVLSVDEAMQSMTFAGDIPEGSLGRLMKANFDRLFDGAAGAAEASLLSLRGIPPRVAILISCVGRRMVLKQRVEEEIEAVRDTLGPTAVLTGFYSNGEIAPSSPGARSDLHNQTMTVTTIAED